MDGDGKGWRLGAPHMTSGESDYGMTDHETGMECKCVYYLGSGTSI